MTLYAATLLRFPFIHCSQKWWREPASKSFLCHVVKAKLYFILGASVAEVNIVVGTSRKRNVLRIIYAMLEVVSTRFDGNKRRLWRLKRVRLYKII